MEAFTLRHLLRALNYLKPHWLIGPAARFSLLISTGASLATPQLKQLIIDRGVSARNVGAVVGRYYEIYNSQFRRQPAERPTETRWAGAVRLRVCGGLVGRGHL
jgi:hypothetical protein